MILKLSQPDGESRPQNPKEGEAGKVGVGQVSGQGKGEDVQVKVSMRSDPGSAGKSLLFHCLHHLPIRGCWLP
jgi:hypothetical protein